MKWSTEYPTKPGFYWIRNYQISYQTYSGELITDPQIVELNESLDYITRTGEEMGVGRRHLICAEWQGPIHPEEEEK